VLDGKRVDPSRYLDDLIDGFASAYRNMLERKMDLLGPGSPLDEFRGLMTRFVFRPTKVYTAILMQCLKPEQLRSGIAWGLELELLARAFVVTAERPKWWSLLDAEWADMLRLDVPYFTARTDARSLELVGGRQLSNVLDCASLSAAHTRVENMSLDDLVFQIEIIRGAYAARTSATAQRPSKRIDADNEVTAPPFTEEICLEQAGTLAKVLAQKALRDTDGGLHWLGFSYVPEAQRLQLDLVPQGLYDGRCGIALFFAALDHVKGGDQYYQLWTQALDAFRKLREDGSNERHSFARSGLGLANGFGGVVYAFVRLYELARISQSRALEADVG
jgi:lantibiotic modifying enzyme